MRIKRGHIPIDGESSEGWLRVSPQLGQHTFSPYSRIPVSVTSTAIDTSEVTRTLYGDTYGESKVIFSGTAVINSIDVAVKGELYRSGDRLGVLDIVNVVEQQMILEFPK